MMPNMAENAAPYHSDNTHDPTLHHYGDVSWNSSLWMVPLAEDPSSQHLNCVASPQHQFRDVSPCPSISSLYEYQSSETSSFYKYQNSEANLDIDGLDHIEGDALNNTLNVGEPSETWKQIPPFQSMSQIPLTQLLHHYQDHIEGGALNDTLDVGEPSEIWKQDWQSKMNLCYLKFAGLEWSSIVQILNSKEKIREKAAYMSKFNRLRNLVSISPIF
jgi:hypothetical protein